jgi:succinate dehydrogenase / fumarate reductase membrane anchor subunit
MTTETPLGQVRALGSARTGAHHWGQERAVSLATLFLCIWFLVSLWRLPQLDLQSLIMWLHAPFVAVPMLLLVVALFWHGKMGLMVVVEDYVHEEGNKLFCTILISFLTLFFAAISLFCVLRLSLAGVAGG